MSVITWGGLFALEALGLERPGLAVVVRLAAGMALVGLAVTALERGQDWLVRRADGEGRPGRRLPAVAVGGAVLGVAPALFLGVRLGRLGLAEAGGQGALLAAAAGLLLTGIAGPWRWVDPAPSARRLVAAAAGGAVAAALFGGLIGSTAVLVAVPPGGLGLQLQFYVGAWAAMQLGAWVLAERALRRVEGGEGRPLVGVAAVAAGALLALADQRLFVGLYPAVHHWLKAHAYLAVDLGVAWLIVGRRLPTAGWVAWLALAAVGLAGQPSLDVLGRASLASGAWGRPLIRALDRSPPPPPPKVPDPALDAVLAPPAPAGAGGGAAAGPLEASRPDLLLVTIDALRADSVPPGGAVAGLMERGVAYARAYSQGAQTDVSVSALMAGRYPLHLPWRRAYVVERPGGWDLVDSPPDDAARSTATSAPGPYTTPLLAERLKAAGYRTAATTYVGDDVLLPKVVGVDRGFDAFAPLGALGWRTPTSARVVERAQAELRRLRAEESGNPWFLWVHLYDPHESGGDRQRYVRLIVEADRALASLLAAVDAPGARPVAIALASDHGEMFGEHGGTGHGASLHEPAVHVPMALVAPGIEPQVETRPVAVLDLAATLCALAGADRSDLDGVNLLPAAAGGAYPADRPVFAEAVRWHRTGGDRSIHRVAMIRGPLKLTWDRLVRTEVLADVVEDPGETDNLALAQPVRAAKLSGLLRYWVARGESLNPTPPGRPAPAR